jgi:amino acid adenylation domain-containing protein
VLTDAKERLAALSEEQRRLLAQRLRKLTRPGSASGIPRRPRTGADFPLSFAQQRFWFLHHLAPEAASYTVTEPHRLKGPLDLEALERAVNGLVGRHEVLRTTFPLVDGQPVQRLASALHVPLVLEDLTGLPAAEREAASRLGANRELRRPFDLQSGPLVRAFVWRHAPEDHFFLLLAHHVVADGWSKRVFVKELLALYETESRGTPCALPELPIQYADYAVWQHDWLRGPALEPHLDYWKRHMAGAPPLQLHGDRPDPQQSRGLHHWQVLPPELTRGVRTLAQSEGVTLFMALLAAFGAVLARHAGHPDIVVGSPIANRNRSEIEDLIGCFMNPLPLRLDLAGDPTFRELLARVRAVALGAYAHQDVPFDLLVRTLQPKRDDGISPLFQVMFLLQNLAWDDLQLSGGRLGARPMTIEEGLGLERIDGLEVPGDLTYPVALEMFEVGAALAGRFEYAPEYAATLRLLPGHFRTLLQAAVEQPDRRLGSLPMLTGAERTRLLVTWNHERANRAPECAHRIIEAQARRRPDAAAVVCGGSRLTYADLNRRANAIARALRARGVTTEVPVGLLLGRSADMIAAVLGVLKSGGAYVPLDPAYPTDRLRYVIADAGVPVVVVDEVAKERLADLAGDGPFTPVMLSLDDIAADDALDVEDMAPVARPENLAYIIYTSGSSGRPKGTMVTHASLANAYRGWEQAYGLESIGVHLQMASLSFDVFAGDFVRALCSGATLVVAPQDLVFSPARLYALMRAERVEAAEFVPVVLRELAAHLDAAGSSLDFMTLLVAGSDSWYTREYADLRRLCGPHTRLVNSYGLTEATIDSTFYDGEGSVPSGDGLVPIGRAFPNTDIVLLDERGDLAPPGVPGELCVGGPALARGYLHRPDLTAERFIPHPYAAEPGQRLYRTGDRARYAPDGTLELLGRIDQQVKLRGFRIELAEVESVLAGHSSVAEVAALVREDRPGDRRLVAYVVPADGMEVSPAGLRRFVRESLPDYMVPSAIVVRADLPLTPNGKVDRQALPAPDGERQSEHAFVAPRTDTEQRVAAIWRSVLHVEQVGLHDNFFDLGGHSLLLVQLHTRLHEAFDTDVTVVELFRYPTVGLLAPRVAGRRAEARLDGVRDRASRQRDAIERRRERANPAAQVRR